MNFSGAKNTLILVPISRKEIDTQDISSALGRLGMLSSDRSSAMSAEGSVSLIFEGYDADPRPLHAIPEVRSWFLMLHAQWGYWTFFANRVDETAGIIMTFLLPGKSMPSGYAGQVGWSFDLNELTPVLLQLFERQNDLVERLEISEKDNERISNEWLQAMMATMELA